MRSDVLYSGSTTLPSFRGHFQRPRIDKLLTDLLDRYLIIVTAGAGSGKTHAISAYLRTTQARVLWFQLSELDNNPIRFWEAFLYAMECQNRETAAQLEQLGFPETLFKFDGFLHILAKEIYSREQVVFVFDDFHLITEELVLRFVRSLICAKLENVCVIISTRMNLDFDLTGMLSNGLAGRLAAEDLYFTLEETEEYLTRQEISLSRRELERVQAFTEGWPLALYLVGLSIKKGGMAAREPLAGAIPVLFDMIERELFLGYTPQVQHFLIRVSLLNAFPEGLVRTLAGEQADYVLGCIQNSMLIYANPYTGEYNFHRLFLDFLHGKQRALSRRETDETHFIAAKWYAANDQKFDALTYYDKCGRYDEILDIILHFGVAVFTKPMAEFYISLIDRLPAELMKEHPVLHVHRAGLLHNNAQMQSAINELQGVQMDLERLPPSQTNRTILGEICCMLGLIYLGIADYGFVDQFIKASEYLPDGSAMIDHTGMAVNTRYAVMLSNPAPGELQKMEDAMFCAMPYASKVMRGYGQGLEYLASAQAAYFTADLKKAAQNAQEAVYRAHEKQVSDVAFSGCFLLMRVEAANGNYEGIVSNLERMRAYAEGLANQWSFNGMPDVADGWFNLLFGSADKIAGWLAGDMTGGDVLAPYSMGIERSVKVRYFLEGGKYYELLAWLAQSERPLRQYNIWLSLLDLLIGKAIALHYTQDEAGALVALQEAYEIAHGNNLIMQFIEYGHDIRAIINNARHSEAIRIPDAWLEEIYTKSATYDKHLRSMRSQHRQVSGKTANPTIKFTKREMEMLGYVCQGLTNAEIASACFVSISAVKKTLNNTYIKLGATNRADAVRIALQMGLTQ